MSSNSSKGGETPNYDKYLSFLCKNYIAIKLFIRRYGFKDLFKDKTKNIYDLLQKIEFNIGIALSSKNDYEYDIIDIITKFSNQVLKDIYDVLDKDKRIILDRILL